VTRDVDLVLLTCFGHEDTFIEALLRNYPARIESAKEFALRNRVLLLKSPDGVGIDISLAALLYEEESSGEPLFSPSGRGWRCAPAPSKTRSC
jgi:hypothetical protein